MRIKKNIYYFAASIGLVSILSSCILAYNYKADILVPAKIDVPLGCQNVGVFSRIDLSDLPSGLYVDQQAINDFKRDSSLLKQMVIGLEDGLIESPRFSVVETSPKRNFAGFHDDLSLNVNWDILKQICPDSTDILIELVTATLNDTVIPQLEPRDYYQNYYCIVTTVYWRVSNLKTKDVSLYRIQDTSRIIDRIDGDYSKTQDPKELLEYLAHGCYNAGIHFSETIAPSWQEIERVYYKSLIPAFYLAELFVREGDWIGAARKWQPLTNSEIDFIASRACFNMALASEMSDQFDLSLEWLKQAKEKKLNRYIDEYSFNLMQRISQVEELDKQLGISIIDQ